MSAVIFIGLVILGVPIAFVLATTGIFIYAQYTTLPMITIAQRMFTGVDNFPLMAIPFFVIAGGLMNAGGVTRQIIRFCNLLVGFLRGGLAAISIVASMIFAGISGSSVADASGLGAILIPSMKEQGYDSDYSAAINATSSTVGIIIPPSIPMVLLGAYAGISIGDLFLAGAFPGLLVGVGMLLMSTWIAYRRGYPKAQEAVTVREALKIVFGAIPAIIMPLFIIGGIITGIVTPTEAGVLAVVYALIVGSFVYRGLRPRNVLEVFIEGGIQTAIVLLIIACATVVSWFLSYQFIPQQIATWMSQALVHEVAVLAVISVICLFIGMFIDVAPALILLGAVLTPVATVVGVSPVQYGLVLITSLSVGLFTPPVGTTLIISCHIAKTPIFNAFKACLPFLYVMLVVLVLIILFPPLTTFLPGLL